MRVAVVGGNFLGCATAFYVREALDANRNDLAEHADAGHREPRSGVRTNTQKGHSDPGHSQDEIVIFEREHRLGGNKFCTRSISGVSVPVGTCAELDLGPCALFHDLLNKVSSGSASGNRSPLNKTSAVRGKTHGASAPDPSSSTLADVAKGNSSRILRNYGVFHWNDDAYRIKATDFTVPRVLSGWPFVSIVLQVAALIASGAMVYFFNRIGVRTPLAFAKVISYQPAPNYPAILTLFSILFGCGLVPVKYMLWLHNFVLRGLYTFLVIRTTYGNAADAASLAAKAMKNHMEEICASPVATTSGITLAHMLSRCGLMKYARQSTQELFSAQYITQSYATDIVTPALSHAYADREFGADHTSNALAGLLDLLTRVQVPPSLRARSQYLDATETDELCPALVRAGRASVSLSSEVTEVCAEDGQFEKYNVRITGNGGKSAVLHGFDAVILCAEMDTDSFSVPRMGLSLRNLLAVGAGEKGEGRRRDGNNARFMGLVKGAFRPACFRDGSISRMPQLVDVVSGASVSQVLQVAPDVYRVTCGQAVTEGSSVIANLFQSVDQFVGWERKVRQGVNGSPLRVADGHDSPSLILQKRFMNANCIDRVGNHPELDCLAARNCASLLRNGVVDWNNPGKSK